MTSDPASLPCPDLYMIRHILSGGGVIDPAAAAELLDHFEACASCGASIAEVEESVDTRDILRRSEEYLALAKLKKVHLCRFLGTGGAGLVFEAEVEIAHTTRTVALKIVHPRWRRSSVHKERFFREARLAAAIQHKRIVVLHQVGESFGMPFIVFERVAGPSLLSWIESRTAITASLGLRLALEIAEGLAAVHEKCVVHRDIKAENIVFDGAPTTDGAPGHIKIVDFGLARSNHPDFDFECIGGAVNDARADLFSFGCLLYHLTTGRPPFSGDSPIDRLRSLVNDIPEAPEFVSMPELGPLIGRLLSKNPEHRPESAGEISSLLAGLASGLKGWRS